MPLRNQKHRLARYLGYGSLLLMVLMPFHAFLTTWVGTNAGGLLLWRAWKELVLFLLVVGGLYIFLTDKELRRVVWSRTVNKVIVVYGVWMVVVSLLSSRDYDALAQGLAINLRFLVFFVLVQVLFYYLPITRDVLHKVLLAPSVVVITFGLLQLYLLPRNFLVWFGYNKDVTIPPYFTVDEQLTNLRYMSTLSGPNTLGAYLVLPILLVASLCRQIVHKLGGRKELIASVTYLVGGLVVMYGTQSRSAWLALLAALGFYMFLKLPHNLRITSSIAAVAVMAVSVIGIYQYRDTQFVQDVLLHDDQTEGGAVSSNSARVEAYKSAAKDLKQRPLFGCGVGCAGPASVRHEDGPKIAENYYVQIAQEAGVVGLLLFMTILGLAAKELYQKRENDTSAVLLASFIGLGVANLLLHTWADDTLAYIWWGALGLVLYNKNILNKTQT